MSANVLAGVMEALDASGLGETPVHRVQALADELAKRFPSMLVEQRPERAHWQRWTTADEQELALLYRSGDSVDAIAAELSRTPGAIRGAITRLRLTR